MDDAIHGVILCLVDNAVRFVNIYQLDTDLPSGYCYLPFENGYWTWYVLVCIKIRIWRTGQHIPTQISGGSSSPPPPPLVILTPDPPGLRAPNHQISCLLLRSPTLWLWQRKLAAYRAVFAGCACTHNWEILQIYMSHQLPTDRQLTSHNPVYLVSSTHVKRIMKIIESKHWSYFGQRELDWIFF